MIDLTYPNLTSMFAEHLDPGRSESASFLIWYLENYYRLEKAEAIDSVCDQRGDRGVDGIYVNHDNQSITVFQSKISQRSDRAIGDSSLREFAGSLAQFSTPDSLGNLAASTTGRQLGNLIKRLKLESLIRDYSLRGEFISNIDIDQNGQDFLDGHNQIEFIGRSRLVSEYISSARTPPPSRSAASFDIAGLQIAEYIVDTNTKLAIAPVMAKELSSLEGIGDQTLFDFNVRGPLGRTAVNKGIMKSIQDQAKHRLFPLFHNGITIIAEELDTEDDSVTIRGEYYVVNGCQSLTALYRSKDKLTDDLRILVKFVQLRPDSEIAHLVTMYSNNQNGVKSRDFRSNHSIQIRFQNEFYQQYRNVYSFEIKRGEAESNGVSISNERAGLMLMAFDLKQPWSTHRGYVVFDDKYSEIFGRPEVTADRLILCQVVMEEIGEVLSDIDHSLFAKHAITRYMLLFTMRLIIEDDPLGQELLMHPGRWVREQGDRDKLRASIRAILGDIVIDLNLELEDAGDDFDYRDKLRDAKWVGLTANKLVAERKKMVRRNKVATLAEELGGAVGG